MTRPLILIDVPNLAFRAGHAFGEAENRDGEPVGAIFGVFDSVVSLCLKFDPAFVACCFDGRKSLNFRKKLFPGYKVRPKKESEVEKRQLIVEQIIKLRELLKILPVRIIYHEREEADDLIGYFATKKFKSPKLKESRRIVVSTDKDFLQLIGKNVDVFNPSRDILFTRKNFKKYYGCKASRWLSVRVMTGDTSDKIPGVGGIGEKYALEIMNRFKSLEQARANEDKGDMPTRLFNLLGQLAAKWDVVERNRELMDLTYRKIKLKGKINIGSWDETRFRKLCLQSGFKMLLPKLPRIAPIMERLDKC